MVSHEFNTVYEIGLRINGGALVCGPVCRCWWRGASTSKSAVEGEFPPPGYANDDQRACQRNPESCGGFPKDLYFGKIRGVDASFGEIDMLSAVVDILLWVLGNVAAPLRWYHTCIGSERGREPTKAVY